ncbi:MAG: hypothetical protein QXI19_05035 [Candidatus Caldarchaeum sp.]
MTKRAIRKNARALWLWMVGERRGDIPAMQAFGWYRRRFDVEHTFRLLKRRMLLTQYQTPEAFARYLRYSGCLGK